MITSRDVFAKRKQGFIDEAYKMAIELVNTDDQDIWNFKALAWCLIDLIKRDTKQGNHTNLEHYTTQLQSIHIDDSDGILFKQAEFALSLTNPCGQLRQEAKCYSKQGNHNKAAETYRRALSDYPEDQQSHEGLGWELYRIIKQLLSLENANIFQVKRLLNEYLILKNERPSRLHSLILGLAGKLAIQESFNLIAFLRIWNLDHLTEDDYQPFTDDKGKIYPSRAEKIFQRASKQATNAKQIEDVEYIKPYIDIAIYYFPENIWLKMSKAKILLISGQPNDALSFSIEIVKAKFNDYWAWELLGDTVIHNDKNLALSCYCKAILCSTDEKFIAKLREKLSKLFIEKDMLDRAKYEIKKILESRQAEGYKIPTTVIDIQDSEWYKTASPSENNIDFYNDNSDKAEALLFHNLPWLNACCGEIFSLPGKKHKVKRKIYIMLEDKNTPFELVIPEKKMTSINIPPGSGLRIKGENDLHGRFQLYQIQPRSSSEDWDIFETHIAVVDHINTDKELIHYIVNKSIEGIINYPNLPKKVSIGDILSLKLFEYQFSKGIRFKVLDCKVADQIPDKSVYKSFIELVRVSNDLGFTESDIFIDRPIIQKYNIQTDNTVSGVAIINFNRKRGVWGWKAISIDQVIDI